MRKMLFALFALAVAGCATVEISSVGSMRGGDRLLVIQNDGYELLWLLPLWSGDLSWDAERNDVSRRPALFANHADVRHLWAAARRIAEREHCDLVDVTFIDNYRALELSMLYGTVKASDLAISAVLRPRK
ncbi:MAG: hypothetical protein ACI4RD_08595 [Kiritimatiellia bacterium]